MSHPSPLRPSVVHWTAWCEHPDREEGGVCDMCGQVVAPVPCPLCELERAIHGNPRPHVVLSRGQMDELMERHGSRERVWKSLQSGVLGNLAPGGVDIYIDNCPWGCTEGLWPTCMWRKWEYEPYCETHQCGATDDVRCGKQSCPHCDGIVTACSMCGQRCMGLCRRTKAAV